MHEARVEQALRCTGQRPCSSLTASLSSQERRDVGSRALEPTTLESTPPPAPWSQDRVAVPALPAHHCAHGEPPPGRPPGAPAPPGGAAGHHPLRGRRAPGGSTASTGLCTPARGPPALTPHACPACAGQPSTRTCEAPVPQRGPLRATSAPWVFRRQICLKGDRAVSVASPVTSPATLAEEGAGAPGPRIPWCFAVCEVLSRSSSRLPVTVTMRGSQLTAGREAASPRAETRAPWVQPGLPQDGAI